MRDRLNAKELQWCVVALELVWPGLADDAQWPEIQAAVFRKLRAAGVDIPRPASVASIRNVAAGLGLVELKGARVNAHVVSIAPDTKAEMVARLTHPTTRRSAEPIAPVRAMPPLPVVAKPAEAIAPVRPCDTLTIAAAIPPDVVEDLRRLRRVESMLIALCRAWSLPIPE